MVIKNLKKNAQGLVSVAAALAGNSVITIAKFAGFFMSGSSALFSEAIHSFADTLNQSFLLIGIKKSAKKPDKEYAYGYGQERFLWALISACGIFFLGAGVTVYHGINFLLAGKISELNLVTFIILIVSFLIEVMTFYTAAKELKNSDRKASLGELLANGDPTTIAVIYEDGIALLGVLVAIASISLTKLTGKYYWDGIGSIVIGLMLGVMAIVLIKKNRSFLMKRAIPEELREKIVEIMLSDPAIEKVLDFKSSILDIGQYRVKCEVEFNGSALLSEEYLGGALREEFNQTSGDYEEFKKFFVENLDRVPRLIGKKIDAIERNVKETVPQVVHIDIEIN